MRYIFVYEKPEGTSSSAICDAFEDDEEALFCASDFLERKGRVVVLEVREPHAQGYDGFRLVGIVDQKPCRMCSGTGTMRAY